MATLPKPWQSPRVRFLLPAFIFLLSSQTEAQDEKVHTDPQTNEQYRLQRPEEGLRRGRWSVPSWVVWSGGASLVLIAAGALLHRIRNHRG